MVSKKKKEFTEENSCRGKIRHESRRAAEGHVVTLRKNSAACSGADLEKYLCTFCGGWHVGNKVRKAPYTRHVGRPRDRGEHEDEV